MESLDYSWLRLVPSRVQWIDDDGSSHWLIPADLANAEPDPLSGVDASGNDRRAALVAEISDRLGDDLLLMAQGLVGRWRASWARLASVDRYGLVVELAEPSGNSVTRIPFPKRLENADEVHVSVAGLRSSARETPTAQAQGLATPRPQLRAAAGPTASELVANLEAEPLEMATPDPSDNVAAEDLVEEDDYSWALWPGTDRRDSAFAGETGLLQGVEGDRRGGADVDGVDVPRHRDSYSLMDSLERAGREARALAAEEESDALAPFDDEFGDGDRPVTGNGGIAGGEGEEPDTGIEQRVEPGREGVESGVGKGVGLTHGDPA